MPVGTPRVHKRISLITLVAKWTGSDAVVTLEEFISSIEISARISRWEETEKVEIALMKVAGSVTTFYKACSELHADSLTWPKFKTEFRNMYIDFHTDQYHYIKLQTARQPKGKDPQLFADRYRDLAGKIICKVKDPVAQRIQNENSIFMLLANFVTGVRGNPGIQCRYANRRAWTRL